MGEKDAIRLASKRCEGQILVGAARWIPDGDSEKFPALLVKREA